MNRRQVELYSPGIGAPGCLLAYGHWGRPLLAFPSQQGDCGQYEEYGMVDAIAWLIEAGRVKLYTVDSFDSGSWHAEGLSLEERARRHALFEDWIVSQVAPWIRGDCAGRGEIAVTGCSFGAYHAANFTLKHADLFPLAICHSGVYDVSVIGGGERGDSVYFNNPMDYVSHLEGDHLEWLRSQASLLLLCGEGAWEDSTGSRESTIQFAELLRSKGLRAELDVWGHDSAHDWPWWRKQLAHHLPRFC